jgi:protein TonB
MNSSIKTNSMHEMLFEKRNKDYGAYAIRNAYNDTVVKSLVMVASTLLLFIGSAYAYNSFGVEKPVAEEKQLEYTQRVVTICPIETVKPLTEKAVYTPKTAAIATVIMDDAPEDPEKKDLLVSLIPSEGTQGDTLPGEPIVIGGTGGGGLPPIPEDKPLEPVLIADTMPEYIGGTKAMVDFLSRNIVYPELPKLMGVEGTVYVNFVVDAKGNVVKCKIVKGIDKDCNEEALRVVAKMPAWKPGKNGKMAVPVMFNLPIRFAIK